MTNSIQDILNAARQANKQLMNVIPADHDHIPLVATARSSLTTHGKLIGVAGQLQSADAAKQAAGIKRLQGLYSQTFEKAAPSLEDARKFVGKELGNLTETIDKLHANSAWQAFATTAAKETETVAKQSNFVSRKFFGAARSFDKYLSKKRVGGKLAIAATGIVVGGVLMQAGGQWLSQGLGGVEQTRTALPDGRIIIESRPIEPAKRTAEILGGTLAGLTGIAAEIGGLFAGYKAFIQPY